MGWKRNRKPKPSISSVTSMSFLTQQNLTFHRFSDGTISCDGKKNPLNNSESLPDGQRQPIWTTNAALNYSAINPNNMNESATSTTNIIPSSAIDDDSIEKNDGIKRYSTYSVGNTSTYSSNVGNSIHQHGSTLKLINVKKDESDSKQSRCSIFRGTILCLCMNLTYANIVRFPRELERHGTAFLVPYLIIMFIIGVPIVLLEMTLGQFLGQGAAQSWKSSPFLKGASIIGRLGAWIGCIWISMHMSLSLLYIGQMSFTKVPFSQCPSEVSRGLHYEEEGMSGQLCLQKTFLRSIRDSSLNFGLLSIGLVFLWVVIMMSTHSSRVNRRSIIMFGLGTLGLLLFQLVWQINNTLMQDRVLPQIWPFDANILLQSSTWFYALVQVILSTQIGVGAIPVMTGKFLYKGDAIRMSTLYMCFNFLVTLLATAYYMTPYKLIMSSSSIAVVNYPDLMGITSVYDRAFDEPHSSYLRKLIPSLGYLMIIFSGIISISIAIYTASRLLRRHPNYIMCLVALCLAIAFLVCPHFMPSRYLDMRLTGLIIVCALVFDIISVTWIYGIKDLSIDLEFSIGRPIMKLWLVLWSTIPLMLTALVTCFIVFPTDVQHTEPIRDFIPKWIPIVACLGVLLFFAIHEVTKQVDYNTFNMIHEATRPAKDWGPADPLVRHAWKQWKSVCDDTGQRDFTLKRRGTKDWTSSIKKGQYSHGCKRTVSSAHSITTLHHNNSSCCASNKYIVNNGKPQQLTIQSTAASMTGGSNSPNYSGSVFGDSAIEEDISCAEKYSSNERDDGNSRKSSTSHSQQRAVTCNQSDASHHRQPYQSNTQRDEPHEQQQQQQGSKIVIGNYQKVPIRISAINDNPRIKRNSYFQAQHASNELDTDMTGQQQYKSRIEIIPTDFSDLTYPPPPAQFQAQSSFMKNPLCHLNHYRGPADSNEQMSFYEADGGSYRWKLDDGHNEDDEDEIEDFRRTRENHLVNNIHIHDSSHDGSSISNLPTSNSTAYSNNWRKFSRNGDEFSTEL